MRAVVSGDAKRKVEDVCKPCEKTEKHSSSAPVSSATFEATEQCTARKQCQHKLSLTPLCNSSFRLQMATEDLALLHEHLVALFSDMQSAAVRYKVYESLVYIRCNVVFNCVIGTYKLRLASLLSRAREWLYSVPYCWPSGIG